ncbi:HGGxSTG domain-containing protein [Niveispirillum fermenti]|uniref:HGGxSTG domain-containing protein n=1 Tax=Niveispirillum fermenti TaxID=1233113 RepID=UPI003A85DB6E
MTRNGTACQAPAIKGAKRCRMHGGRGSGAPEGNRNAWKHGTRSAETLAAAQYLNRIARTVGH